MIKELLTFVVGAAAGAVGMYFYLNKKIEKDIQEGVQKELDAREKYKNGYQKVKENEAKKSASDTEMSKDKKAPPVIKPRYDKKASDVLKEHQEKQADPEDKNAEYVQKTPYNKIEPVTDIPEVVTNPSDDIYIEITEEAFMSYMHNSEYTVRNWSYYDDTDELYDETDYGPENPVGEELSIDLIDRDTLNYMAADYNSVRESGDIDTVIERFFINKYKKEVIDLTVAC